MIVHKLFILELKIQKTFSHNYFYSCLMIKFGKKLHILMMNNDVNNFFIVQKHYS